MNPEAMQWCKVVTKEYSTVALFEKFQQLILNETTPDEVLCSKDYKPATLRKQVTEVCHLKKLRLHHEFFLDDFLEWILRFLRMFLQETYWQVTMQSPRGVLSKRCS